jgi:hypothetical protein
VPRPCHLDYGLWHWCDACPHFTDEERWEHRRKQTLHSHKLINYGTMTQTQGFTLGPCLPSIPHMALMRIQLRERLRLPGFTFHPKEDTKVFKYPAEVLYQQMKLHDFEISALKKKKRKKTCITAAITKVEMKTVKRKRKLEKVSCESYIFREREKDIRMNFLLITLYPTLRFD